MGNSRKALKRKYGDCKSKAGSGDCSGVVLRTATFLDLLRKSDERRVIFVSSSMGSIPQAADPFSKYYSSSEIECWSSKRR
ncbi:Short-chain dehydrogenase/reductase SDR [Penicillium hispanicum]|uniref:Short-chain dehydrogenase/reductase SDR n=1 Tax=Penicillium hispanicum TaxID=1080232 RepID=UPI0025417949|nr:Short-chain dehydrogenase/reductase SDR [Penicillium hispanicum]KAJ5587686.1 Short-chain dehydrogenase/reductase SDR [Penicillium hispanicum]